MLLNLTSFCHYQTFNKRTDARLQVCQECPFAHLSVSLDTWVLECPAPCPADLHLHLLTRLPQPTGPKQGHDFK